MDNLGFRNEVYFELVADNADSLIIQEPLNWDSDDRSYEISSNGGGVLMKTNTELKLAKDGSDWCRKLQLINGFDATATIIKRGKDITRSDEAWRKLYYSELDLLNATWNERTCKTTFKQGGLFDKITTRYSDDYDLVNTESADGKDIGEVKKVVENCTGRAIFRKSELEVSNEYIQEIELTGGDRDDVKAIPFVVVSNSDGDYINGITTGANSVAHSSDAYDVGETSFMLYDRSDRQKELRLKGNINFEVIDSYGGNMYLEYVWYDYINEEYIFNRSEQKATIDTGISLNNLSYDFNNETIMVGEDESLAIVLRWRSDSYTAVIQKAKLKYKYSNTLLAISLDDLYPPTQAYNILVKDLFKRLVAKITGKENFISDYLDSDEFKLLSITSGFWSRGFDFIPNQADAEGETKDPKQFNISLKTATESLNCLVPVFWFIGTVNGKEYLRLEHKDFKHQNFIGVEFSRTIEGESIKIPVSNLERTILTKELYTFLEFGYEKGGTDYEEVIGLSSAHGKLSYNTCLTNKETSKYSQISRIRADVEGHELARIKQFINFPEEDTTYDQDLFWRDLIVDTGGYRLRQPLDDFNTLPSGGIYSPETTGNLRLTPRANAIRHSKIYATGFYNKLNPITFISSNYFSSIIIDGIKESDSIKKEELKKPYINGYLLSFEGVVYQEIIDKIEGKTKGIPNWYGLFEIETNEGDIYRGRLIKSIITGTGKHEIAEV